jgi:amidase
MSARPGEHAPTTWYLFSVGVDTPPVMTIDSGQEVTLEVRGAFADVRDIRDVPTPFTPACDGHPLAPIAGPVRIRGAEPGDAVAIDLLEITPHGDGITAILRDFGVLRKEYGEPKALVCPVRDGRAWFGGRIPIPLNPNLGTVSTMPPEGYKPSYAGPYGGDFDQKDVKVGSRVHLPVMVPGALVFFADPHAAISDGIVTGTGVECTSTVRARITLHKGRAVARPIVEVDDTVQVLGFGPSVEEATEDATRAAIDVVAQGAGMDPEEAHAPLDRRRAPHRNLSSARDGRAPDHSPRDARRRRLVRLVVRATARQAGGPLGPQARKHGPRERSLVTSSAPISCDAGRDVGPPGVLRARRRAIVVSAGSGEASYSVHVSRDAQRRAASAGSQPGRAREATHGAWDA